MIIKILDDKDRTFKGVLFYNQKSASELLAIENYPSDNVRDLCRELEYISSMRASVKDPVFHAMISYAYDEEVSKDDMLIHAREYLTAMGYGTQPYGVFLHTDRDHVHIHLVTTRIDRKTLKKISDSNEGWRTLKILKRMERKYGLTKSFRTQQGLVHGLNDALSDVMRTRPTNYAELAEACSQQGLTMIRSGRGVLFAFDDGEKRKPINSSDLPLFKSKPLVQRLRANRYVKRKAKDEIRQVLDELLKTPISVKDLRSKLREKGMRVAFDRNSAGIYGVRFFYKGVSVKGSEVGYSYAELKKFLILPKRTVSIHAVGRHGHHPGTPSITQVYFDTEARGARSMDDEDEDEKEKYEREQGPRLDF